MRSDPGPSLVLWSEGLHFNTGTSLLRHLIASDLGARPGLQ